ncbi:MAG: ANTAR domain-containing response regulator [Candidatus Nanopelagicaceae bacterium]|jgi:response regulator NasT
MAISRILIAEDETLIRMDLSEMLKEAGYQVVGEATDGVEAIELAKELKPDLAILDVKMPKLDGISAASEIITICPTLMLTAFSQRELVERARDAGVMGYVVKPFTIADLVPAIEIASSRFVELNTLREEIADLTERLETRKLLDRAKGVLMQTLKLSEVQAYQWIQKTAMDQRITMKELALGILDPKQIRNVPPESNK